jgi:Tfp pilus assembly protein PilF
MRSSEGGRDRGARGTVPRAPPTSFPRNLTSPISISPRSSMRFPIAILAVALLAAPLPAQKPDKDAARLDSLLHAPRPALDAGADTNDTESYLKAGHAASAGCLSPFLVALIRSGFPFRIISSGMCDPGRAAAAFHWAARLDPARAEPLLLGWQATWSASPKASEKHWENDRKFAATGIGARVDSLYLRAMYLNPFVARVTGVGGSSARYTRAYLAKHPDNVEARIDLASAHYEAQRWDSTIANLRLAIASLEKRDSTTTRRAYASKAMFHFGIGHALLASGDRRAAQESFRQALAEDFAFYPAHAALAVLAWENWSDSTTAVQEFELALQTGATDAALRYNYGTVLMELRHTAEALAQFEAAMASSPEYALPWYNGGVAADRLGRTAEAARYYREFARRAPRRLQERAAQAVQRAAALEEGRR